MKKEECEHHIRKCGEKSMQKYLKLRMRNCSVPQPLYLTDIAEAATKRYKRRLRVETIFLRVCLTES